MPRIAMAAPATDEDASSTRVDDLIQRGRSQGHLSLSDLRTAFEQAGLTPQIVQGTSDTVAPRLASAMLLPAAVPPVPCLPGQPPAPPPAAEPAAASDESRKKFTKKY